MKLLFSALVLSLGLISAPQAHANELSLVAAGTNSNAKVNGFSNFYDAQTTIGGGMLLEFRSTPGFGFEIGALYAPRKFSDTQLTAINIPVVLRFHLANFLSIGVGGFFDNYIGDVKFYGNNAGSPSANGFSSNDYGLLGSLALRFPLGSSTHFLIDGRYLYGMKDQLAGPNEAKFHDIQVLAGLQFWL